MNENKTASDKITLDRDFFEHLLNCLANQKFITEVTGSRDCLVKGEKLCKKEKEINQDIIDIAWNKGMFIINS